MNVPKKKLIDGQRIACCNGCAMRRFSHSIRNANQFEHDQVFNQWMKGISNGADLFFMTSCHRNVRYILRTVGIFLWHLRDFFLYYCFYIIRSLKTTKFNNTPTDNDVMPLKIPHIGKTQRMTFIQFAASTAKYEFNSSGKFLNRLIASIFNE